MSNTETQRFVVGDATITSVVEDETDGIPPEFFFPAATAAEVAAHSWLVPDYARPDGTISLRVQAFVVAVDGVTFLVDPCVGNGKVRALPFWSEQSWPWLERLASAGVLPVDVDVVVHTHLHADHVGWDSRLEGSSWVPAFGGARYLYTEADLEFSRANQMSGEDVYADSIAPVLDAGLGDVVAADADLGHGLSLEPTPGHTPGHVSLWIRSAGEGAVITGDFMHHPVQFAVPEWAEVADSDVEQGRETRRRMMGALAESGALVLGTHFGVRPAGRVVADGGAWRFVPV